MKIHHVIVEESERWLAAHALEDESVHTQGKTLGEITGNIRDVAQTLCGDKEIHVELVIPTSVKVALRSRARPNSSPASDSRDPRSARSCRPGESR